jgi:cephalosporin hydroxylase
MPLSATGRRRGRAQTTAARLRRARRPSTLAQGPEQRSRGGRARRSGWRAVPTRAAKQPDERAKLKNPLAQRTIQGTESKTFALSREIPWAMDPPATKPIADWKIREWLEYHQTAIHQGSLNQNPGLQQRWMGRIIWKNPLDCWIYQEILYDTKPEAVVELGVAQGGGTLYLASLLELLGNRSAQVVGVDLDLGRVADLCHPRVRLIEGNCVDSETIGRVRDLCRGRRTMVLADCEHSKDHVLEELRAYSPLVSVGCYYIVEDGICDVMGWPPVPGPRAACIQFLGEHPDFASDARLREKYLITYNFNGYLKRVR